MGRVKNIKLAKLFSLGLISCFLFNISIVKAEVISLTDGTVIEEVTLNNVNDINSADNIGVVLSVKGTIVSIEEGYITIKDGSGEAKLYIDGIAVDEFKVDDYIFVSGTVNIQGDINVIIVSDSNQIGKVANDEIENPGEEEPDDTEKPDEEVDNSTTSKPEENSGQNNNSGNSAGSSSSKPSSSGSSTPSGTSSNVTTSSKATIKGKTATTISYDLSSTQWEAIQSAYDSGSIKLQDLPDNKIRIVKVSEEAGDTVWIVNDPRQLDVSDESVFTVGIKLLEQIEYTEYDVTESKWTEICEDVNSGSAKIKLLDDDSIKVIYNKADGVDSTTTILKK